MKTLKLGSKRWGDPTKIEARLQTIIKPYRSTFGESLPADQQYWTLCGEMADGNKLQAGCELDQMVCVGLIKPSQFHGVEGNQVIHQANIKAIQEPPWNSAILYQGEFTEVIDTELGKGTFRPGIVYLDTIQEPKLGARLLADTMDILNHVEGSVMLAWNTILGQRHYNRHHSWDDVASELQKNELFRVSVRQGWKQMDERIVFQYPGTGRKSSTTMGTVVFVRKSGP